EGVSAYTPGAGGARPAIVEPSGVDERDAGAHELSSTPLAIRGFRSGELALVVHSQDLRSRLRDNSHNCTAVADGGTDTVGQIILSLRIVGLEGAEPRA